MIGLTSELARAFAAVTKHSPRVHAELLTGLLTPERQHEFANLLSDVAELLHEHADDQANGIIPRPNDHHADVTIPRTRAAQVLIDS